MIERHFNLFELIVWNALYLGMHKINLNRQDMSRKEHMVAENGYFTVRSTPDRHNPPLLLHHFRDYNLCH
jgi:hypothetical protein